MTIPPGPPHGHPGPPPYGYGYGYPPPPPPPKPGVIPLAPLTFSTILTGAFATFGRYWKQLLGVAAVIYLGALLVVGAAIGIAYAVVGDVFPAVFDLPSGQEPRWEDIRPLLIAFVCVWLAAMIAMVCANALVAAACPAVVQEAVLGRPTTFGAIWRRAWDRMPAVLGTVFLTSAALVIPMLLFLGGFVAMMIALFAGLADASTGAGPDPDGPGISFVLPLVLFLVALSTLPFALWIWVKFSLAPAAAVMEGQGPVASMRRSSLLVRGDGWRVFGCLLAAGIMASVVGMLIQQVLSTLASTPLTLTDFSGEDSGAVIASLIVIFTILILGQLISQVVVSVFPPLVTALLYVDQRIRKENLAPELARAAGLA
ncbi:oxidoreductase [Streptomyces sp. NPDC056525]|uniref:oxidoreductase n=1 Tax=unclassified Streptomyces TaxID=2593676 RepID=UPI00367B32D7